LHAKTCTPDESETCLVVVEEGHVIGVVKPGTAWKAALRTVFVYIYQVHIYILLLCVLFFSQKYNVQIRGRAVEIFSTCVFTISAMSDYNNGVTKTLLNPMLPSFSERFVHGLQMPNGIHSDFCLKSDIIKGKFKKSP
jgi:hypothetical protein